ncbi:MAG TPA: hypothetical protein DCZ92_00695 [Elusimicrobia bacterium]|nr:MAG: hypothetical protein A2016_10000 [Elusimicrobia bacterium GWF2_62_30]HBA59344.1 hypothetical protein [Elusimicrobiota bacterium]
MNKDAAAREIMLLGALGEARAAAFAAGIELVALKGAALLELGLYKPGERGMTDVDVLVRRGNLAAFEKTLAGVGFEPMPDSADAWLRPGPGNSPPAIIDIHAGLWHIENNEELFDWGLEPGPEGLALNLPDLFLHVAVHPLLHHGEVTPRCLEDCRRAARKGVEVHGRGFWPSAARKAGFYGLRPAVWAVIRRLLAAGDIAPEEAALFSPRGTEKIKAAFFEKAARKHSTLLEYLLPALQRPGLVADYLLPQKRFMLRRYGSASLLVYLLRPLRLLGSVLFRR